MKTLDLNFAQGISLIIPGHFFPDPVPQIAVASPSGEVKLLLWNNNKESWDCKAEFDLTQNGAIWNMIAVDLTGEGIDDLILGGMQGAVICLSPQGNQKWIYQFNSAISGIISWKHHLESCESGTFQIPKFVIYSLDRTLRVIDHNGVLIWAQMFAGGVTTACIGDIDQDGSDEIIAGSNDGTLRVFDGKNGKIKWFHESGQTIRVSTIRGNWIIFGNDSKKIVVLDGLTHEIITEKELPCYPWLLKPIPNTTDKIILSTYSFRYLGAEEDVGIPGIYCFQIPNLQILWEKNMINIQDLQISQILDKKLIGLWGTTDGEISIWDVDSGLPFMFDTKEFALNSLESTVNTIQLLEYPSSNITWNQIFLIGCDNPQLYFFGKGIVEFGKKQ
jgi:outer membrane protein assembly factor BamB